MLANFSAAAATSAGRAIPLVARADLAFSEMSFRGVEHFVAKDPVSLQYHRLRAEQHAVLQALDGRASLNDLRNLIAREFPSLQWTLNDIQRLVMELYKQGLLHSQRPGQSETFRDKEKKAKRKQLWQTLMNVLSLRIPGWDPQRTLDALMPYVRWLFAPWAVALTVMFFASSWLTLAIDWSRFQQTLPEFSQFFGWPNVLWLWAAMAATKVCHEFGHGLATRYFGAECHSMGVMLLVFSPALYCDTTDSWMLKNKWARIAIGGAGMYVESILSAIAIYIWWASTDGFLHYLALNVFFVTAVSTIIFNANPLMKLDGYYMFSDWIEVPNLHARSTRALRDQFARHALGIRIPREPWARPGDDAKLATFAALSLGYRLFVLTGIAVFLFEMLKPYGLQGWGVALASISLATSLGMLIYAIIQIIRTPGRPPMNPFRTTATIAVAGILLVAVCLAPIPLYLEAAFVLEPDDAAHVYVRAPGRLESLRVKPGDSVEQGQVIAVLANSELEERRLELQQELRIAAAQARLHDALEEHSQQMLAQEHADSLRAQIAEVDEQLADLVLRAPVDGVVVEPPSKADKADEQHLQLAQWSGTPLDAKNHAAWLEPQTEFLAIAPTETSRVVLYVQQTDRNDLAVGQTVRLKFDHLPWHVFSGKISQFAARSAEYAPRTLSNKLGGSLSTNTDERGEKLMDQAYQAVVTLSDSTDLFRPGMRGRARCIIVRRTLVEWAWRWVRLTFDFQV